MTNDNDKNPQVTGVIASGNAKLTIRGRVSTTSSRGGSVTGISSTGNTTIIVGDVVTTRDGRNTSVSIDGGIRVSGNGVVRVAGEVIYNGHDVTESFAGNPHVQTGLGFFDQNNTTQNPSTGNTECHTQGFGN